MTQAEFARRIGVDQATLNHLELQKQNITLATLQKLCDRLHCQIGWLFGEHDEDIGPRSDNEYSDRA